MAAQLVVHSSHACRARLASADLGTPGERGRARCQSSGPGPPRKAGSNPAAWAAQAQPRPTLPPQGAPARERPCSCSSAPASSASSRPLSEPSKQPESRGMSTLGSATVCATGSWPLSAPSSASSLPAARGQGGRGMWGSWPLAGRGFRNPGGPMWVEGPWEARWRPSLLLVTHHQAPLPFLGPSGGSGFQASSPAQELKLLQHGASSQDTCS